MNMSDVGQPKCTLHRSEVKRLLSWLKYYPIASNKDECKSLESILEMSLSLSFEAKQ